MILSADGTLAVVHGREALALGLNGAFLRSGSCCLCGGSGPEARAVKKMGGSFTFVTHHGPVECTEGHDLWFVVRTADLKPPTFPVDLSRWQAPPAPVAKVVDEWPQQCPRCKREKSAYLGLNEYDCRWGCYAKPQAVVR